MKITLKLLSVSSKSVIIEYDYVMEYVSNTYIEHNVICT